MTISEDDIREARFDAGFLAFITGVGNGNVNDSFPRICLTLSKFLRPIVKYNDDNCHNTAHYQ